MAAIAQKDLKAIPRAALCQITQNSTMSVPKVTPPTFEHHHSGIGIGTGTPRLSWRFTTSEEIVSAWHQTSYEIEVCFNSVPDTKPEKFVIQSSNNVLVPWPARPLTSRESATVRVRVTGARTDESNREQEDSEPGVWSQSSLVEVAVLDPKEFIAQFITSPARTTPPPNEPLRPIRFRKAFDLPANSEGSSTTPITLRGRLYITALGVFNVYVNGQSASSECLAPGWTSYKHRLAYRTLDVTHLLLPGQQNVIAAEVGEGWYAGRLGFGGGQRFRYGNELGLFAQLEVTSVGKEGSSRTLTVGTDDSWSTAPSALTSSELYDGEVYDQREDVTQWQAATTSWPNETSGSKVLDDVVPLAHLVSPDAPPVRIIEEVACKEVFRSKSGQVILDFGQNLVGKLCIRKDLHLADGKTIEFRHAEVMEAGELGVRPLRAAKCKDIIIGTSDSDKSLQGWTPQFTFHGFRYVQVNGWPADDVKPSDLVALVMHTDMKRRGHFECSNPFVNQLHKNVVWSMRGNFLSVPTDCPQRDERLGWTGDLQAFCPTATFLYDTLGMLGSWLEDLSAEQLAPGCEGIVPLVVPETLPSSWKRSDSSQAVWGDVAILTPGSLYENSADAQLLERQLASMKGWLYEGVRRDSDGLWDPERFQLADWLDPNAPPDDPAKATTDSVLVANAYLIHVTETYASLCDAMGRVEEGKSSREEASKLKTQFQRRYITPDGNLVSLSQTGIALAVNFGLYPHEAPILQRVASTLSSLVRKSRFNISTGFAGTPAIAHALTRIGKPQLAYRMLLETNCPSWLYPIVSHGATTIWERWDSMLPNGTVNPGEMTSFNHYALGAVVDWLHTSVGGISPLEPGWKKIRVRPVPGGNLTSAKVSFDGPYGLVKCEWTLEKATNKFNMLLTVPPNCDAEVTLPSDLKTSFDDATKEKITTVASGVHHFDCICDPGEWPPKPLLHPFMKQPEDGPIAGD